eukprot:3654833-Pyramimonas_sp.AAC.1
MTEIETPDPAHYNRALGTLNTTDRIFVSFPGWVCNQLFTSGQVSKIPEVLHAQGLSDHAPLVVSLAGGPPIPSGERPIPKHVFLQPECKEYLSSVGALGDACHLPPPLLPQYPTRIMREAASVARNAMIVRRPESIDTKSLIVKSISRA